MKKRRTSEFKESVQRLGKKKRFRSNEIHQDIRVKPVKVAPQKGLTTQTDPLNEFIAQLSHYNPSHRRNALQNILSKLKENPSEASLKSGLLLIKILKCGADVCDKVRAQYLVLLKFILQTMQINSNSSYKILPFLNNIALHFQTILTNTIPTIRLEALNLLEIYKNYLQPSHFISLLSYAAKPYTNEANINIIIETYLMELYNRCINNMNLEPLNYCVAIFRITDIAVYVLQYIKDNECESELELTELQKLLDEDNEDPIRTTNISKIFNYIKSLQNIINVQHKLNYDIPALKRLKSIYSINSNSLKLFSLVCICHIMKCLKIFVANFPYDGVTAKELYALLYTYSHLDTVDDEEKSIINEINFLLVQCSSYLYSTDDIKSDSIVIFILPQLQLDLIFQLINIYYSSTANSEILLNLFFQLWNSVLNPNGTIQKAISYLSDAIESKKKMKVLFSKFNMRFGNRRNQDQQYLEFILSDYPNADSMKEYTFQSFLDRFNQIFETQHTLIASSVAKLLQNAEWEKLIKHRKYHHIFSSSNPENFPETYIFPIKESNNDIIASCSILESDSNLDARSNTVSNYTPSHSNSASASCDEDAISDNSLSLPSRVYPEDNSTSDEPDKQSNIDAHSETKSSSDDNDDFLLNCAFAKNALSKNKILNVNFNIDNNKNEKFRKPNHFPVAESRDSFVGHNTVFSVSEKNCYKILSAVLSNIGKLQSELSNLCTNFFFCELISSDELNEPNYILKALLWPEKYGSLWLCDWLFYIALSVKFNISFTTQNHLVDNFIDIINLLESKIHMKHLKSLKNKLVTNYCLWYFLNNLEPYKSSSILVRLITSDKLNRSSQLQYYLLSLPCNIKIALLNSICLPRYKSVILKLLIFKILTNDMSSQVRKYCTYYLPYVNHQCLNFIKYLKSK